MLLARPARIRGAARMERRIGDHGVIGFLLAEAGRVLPEEAGAGVVQVPGCGIERAAVGFDEVDAGDLAALQGLGREIAPTGAEICDDAAKAGIEAPGLTVGLRYMRLSQYLGEELPRRLSGQRLAAVRLELCESIPPMSLFVAVARVGAFNAPILDLVYDTTDSTPCLRAFAHVPIEPWASGLLDEAVALLPDSRWDKWIGPRADPDREA